MDDDCRMTRTVVAVANMRNILMLFTGAVEVGWCFIGGNPIVPSLSSLLFSSFASLILLLPLLLLLLLVRFGQPR